MGLLEKIPRSDIGTVDGVRGAFRLGHPHTLHHTSNPASHHLASAIKVENWQKGASRRRDIRLLVLSRAAGLWRRRARTLASLGIGCLLGRRHTSMASAALRGWPPGLDCRRLGYGRLLHCGMAQQASYCSFLLRAAWCSRQGWQQSAMRCISLAGREF